MKSLWYKNRAARRLVMGHRTPAVSGLTFTRRDADEKKFPALCRYFPTRYRFSISLWV